MYLSFQFAIPTFWWNLLIYFFDFFLFEARVHENAQILSINGAEIWVTILMHPAQPQIHVKNPFSGNINTRLGIYKVQLFKLGRHFCIVSIEIGPRLCHVLQVLGVATCSTLFSQAAKAEGNDLKIDKKRRRTLKSSQDTFQRKEAGVLS